MSKFKLFLFVILLLSVHKSQSQISDKRLCADKECKEAISLAKTLLVYNSPAKGILSFKPNVDVVIYSKSAGNNTSLWGGTINEKRGYFPKKLVRETKILKKSPSFLVDTEIIVPHKVQEAYEVVEGTTIYETPSETAPLSSESTAKPAEEPQINSGRWGESTISSLPESNSKEETNVHENVQKIDTGNFVKSEETEKLGEKQENPVNKAEEQIFGTTVKEIVEGEGNVKNDPKLDKTKEKHEIETIIIEENRTEAKKDEEDNIQKEGKLEETQRKETSNDFSFVETINNLNETTENYENQKEIIENFELKQNNDLKEDEENEAIVEIEEIPKVLEKVENFNNIKLQNETSPEENETAEFSVVKNEANFDIKTVGNEEEEEEKLINTVTTEVPNIDLEMANVEQVTENVEKIPENLLVKDEENMRNMRTFPEIVNETEENEKIDSNQVPDLNFVGQVGENVEKTEEIPENLPENNEEYIRKIFPESEIVNETEENEKLDSSPGIFATIFSYFNSKNETENIAEIIAEDNKEIVINDNKEQNEEKRILSEELVSKPIFENVCDANSLTTCEKNEILLKNIDENQKDPTKNYFEMDMFKTDIFLYLLTTSVSVILFLFGYIFICRNKREGPLISKINKLEKELLILLKENENLQLTNTNKLKENYDEQDLLTNNLIDDLKQQLVNVNSDKLILEEQIQSLEKELENSTEVGMELNRMLTEILNSQNGSEILKGNVENFQRQLLEQQTTINTINDTLSIKDVENHELKLEIDISNKKIMDLQCEVDKLLQNVWKIEEAKEQQQNLLENQLSLYKSKCEEQSNVLKIKEEENTNELKAIQIKLNETERDLNLKIKEFSLFKETIKINNEEKLKAMEFSQLKAELEMLKLDKENLLGIVEKYELDKKDIEKKLLLSSEDLNLFKQQYNEADRIKMEALTKLEVLSNYFKEKEQELQKEISKHESMWMERQGEATSTTERIKFLQEQMQNYKAQTESLKQEIVNQEVDLKSQISMLEKKAHENWVMGRQAERKLEEAKQEAAQLRQRLTLRERSILDDKSCVQPLENGDLPLSPGLESPSLHIRKSPPLPVPGLPPFPPPPFMPPPPGGPFMGIPGLPPFMAPPPPHNLFSMDHRPPPLGRMSSPPPLNSRYSPDFRTHSPYTGHSSSPPSDSEYGRLGPSPPPLLPPPHRGYSPYNDWRDFKKFPNGRNKAMSSGSGNSNESFEKINRHSKV